MAGTTHRNHGRKIERQQQLELRGLAVFCGTRSASAPSPGRVQQGAAWCCLLAARCCLPAAWCCPFLVKSFSNMQINWGYK
ncbi:hypothetical protein P8452_32887 [Trifolium repens]|nr:hypothetical protein P8452_32887 [Trifolium repens]